MLRMLADFATVLVFIVLGAVSVALMLGISRLLRPRNRTPVRGPVVHVEGGRPRMGAHRPVNSPPEGRHMSHDPAHSGPAPAVGPVSLGPEAHVMGGNADKVINWGRKSSLWCLLFAAGFW